MGDSFHHSKKLIMYGYGMNPYQQAAFGGYNRGFGNFGGFDDYYYSDDEYSYTYTVRRRSAPLAPSAPAAPPSRPPSRPSPPSPASPPRSRASPPRSPSRPRSPRARRRSNYLHLSPAMSVAVFE